MSFKTQLESERSPQVRVLDERQREAEHLKTMCEDIEYLASTQERLNEILDVQQDSLNTAEDNLVTSQTDIHCGLMDNAKAMKSKAHAYTGAGTALGSAIGGAVGIIGGPGGIAAGALAGAAVGTWAGRKLTKSAQRRIDKEVHNFKLRHEIKDDEDMRKARKDKKKRIKKRIKKGGDKNNDKENKFNLRKMWSSSSSDSEEEENKLPRPRSLSERSLRPPLFLQTNKNNNPNSPTTILPPEFIHPEDQEDKHHPYYGQGHLNNNHSKNKNHEFCVSRIWENQRWAPVVGWTNPTLAQRPPWSDRHGRKKTKAEIDCSLPDGWSWAHDWRVYVTSETDTAGWRYAIGFLRGKFVPYNFRGSFVRTREWRRTRVKDKIIRGPYHEEADGIRDKNSEKDKPLSPTSGKREERKRKGLNVSWRTQIADTSEGRELGEIQVRHIDESSEKANLERKKQRQRERERRRLLLQRGRGGGAMGEVEEDDEEGDGNESEVEIKGNSGRDKEEEDDDKKRGDGEGKNGVSLLPGTLRVQQRVREGSFILRTQSDQIRSMHRSIDIQEDVIHTTKRVRRAVTVSGALINFLTREKPDTKPLDPIAGNDQEINDQLDDLNLNEETDQVYAVLSQIRDESQEQYDILTQQIKEVDSLQNKVSKTTQQLKVLK